MLERIFVAAGVFVAANFCMSYIIPAPAASPASIIFPFGRTDAQSSWTFGHIEGWPLVLMLALAATAVLAFVGAFLATFGWWVPEDWWRTLVLIGAGCSATLFLLHLGPWAILPLALDALLLWVAWASLWTPASVT